MDEKFNVKKATEKGTGEAVLWEGLLYSVRWWIDAKENVVAKAKDEEQIFYADIDLSDSVKIRKDRPYTDLRRTEFYQ